MDNIYKGQNNIEQSKNKDEISLIKYKEYFKAFYKFKKYNSSHRTHLNSMYLLFRDKYQKFVTNKNNSFGLRLKGNKTYENLPINIFQNNYVLNTFNISKELENKVLGFFIHFEKKRLTPEKKLRGKKLKLTPIPFKNKELIETYEERKNIQEAKRSAVLMRRLEYTHLIKNFKSKSFEENEEYSINLTNKIFILKGAILIIEDWWIKIKNRRNNTKNKKRKCKNIMLNKSNKKRNINDKHLNLDTKVINQKNNIMEINTSKSMKQKNVINYKKPSKLHIESSYVVDSKTFKKNNSNNINLKSSNNFNNSTALNSKLFQSYKNVDSNEKDKNNKILFKINEDKRNENKIIYNNAKSKNKINISNNSTGKRYIKEKNRNIIKTVEKTKTNIIDNNINIQDLNDCINIESIKRIRKRVFSALNKNNYLKKHRNKISYNIQGKDSLYNTSTNDKTLKKKISLNKKNHHKNNIITKNNLKTKKTSVYIYDFKDIEEINNSINSNRTNETEKNEGEKLKIKKSEFYIKTNYDIDRKYNHLNTNKNKFAKTSKNRGNELKNKYNIINGEETDSDIKYVESKENNLKLNRLKNKNSNFNQDMIKIIYINIDNSDNNEELNSSQKNENNLKEIIKDNENETKKINEIVQNEINNNQEINDTKEDNIINNEDIEINELMKKYRTYSFNKNRIPQENNNSINKINLNNNKDIYEIKILNESPTIKENTLPKLNNIKELSFSINNKKNEKHFNNLIITENKDISFIHNSKPKINLIENVDNNFELTIISNKKNDINKTNELKVENKYFEIINNNLNNNNNMALSINNNLQIEFKNKDENDIINNQNEDSEILPIEPDNQRFFIFEGIIKPKEIKYNNQISSHFNFSLKSKNDSLINNKNIYKNINNNKNENNNDNSEDEMPEGIYDDEEFNIYLPKSGKYNLCEKINDLFNKDIKKNIILPNKIEEEKKIEINKHKKNNNNLNNFNINNNKRNNYKLNETNFIFNNYNYKLRSKSENKKIKNQDKTNYIYTNITFGVPDNIREIYKMYKTKSAIGLKGRKSKSIEFLRILEDKYEYE